MKWDWDIDAVRLRKEFNRERNALKASGTTLFVFAVVKPEIDAAGVGVRRCADVG